MMTKYTADEVGLHNTADDLWMIMHGGVYDLTKFLQEHPGGEEVLLNLAGQDGTTCFEEMGHTSEAVQLRETMKIGVLSTERKAGPSTTTKSTSSSGEKSPSSSSATLEDDDNWEYEEHKPEPSNLPTIFIGSLVAIYAILLYYWYL